MTIISFRTAIPNHNNLYNYKESSKHIINALEITKIFMRKAISYIKELHFCTKNNYSKTHSYTRNATNKL